jgi:epoxyqueuosine reductase
MSAARAGLVTYGKNCFAFARKSMMGASWALIIPLLIDVEIAPDDPSIEVGCPSWCRNACIAACPTRAIYAQKRMRPQQCISFQTYYSTGITAMELREPMGTWVYGCDRCQEVCPRNQSSMNRALPDNGPLMERVHDFELDTLLAMSEKHYVEKVWPLAFYISKDNVAKWRMNAARALGNQGDREHIPLLARTFKENESEIVRGMCAWALGRLGGAKAKKALESRRSAEEGLVKDEIESALENIIS